VPMSDATSAISRLRKVGTRSGRQKPVDLGEFEMACDVVIRADFLF